jgi:hypothetical protein
MQSKEFMLGHVMLVPSVINVLMTAQKRKSSTEMMGKCNSKSELRVPIHGSSTGLHFCTQHSNDAKDHCVLACAIVHAPLMT